MKIAIVAPSPVPFTIGGAENLWWGLQNHINENTSHQCELIKIPSKEHSFWDLIESYQKFYELDLSYFDMVISSKYPSWMIRHDNHHLYIMHCLRGLYDTYSFMNMPLEFDSKHNGVKDILRMLNDKPSTIDDFFNNIYGLKDDSSVPEGTFGFPGPFIRKILHFLDKRAMAGVKRFSAISKTVADRKEYYPEGTRVNVIYPPSNFKKFKTGAYEYFFTISRLDNAKRIRMIIEAYLKTKTDISLKIAGTGPQEQELKKLAKGDSRIEFLGFISNNDAIDYYSNAYAVIFTPYDEDYGLITIEAMMSEKPVITFSDSGGVTEFVENDKTGFICDPDISKLTKVIDDFSLSREKVINMGKEAKKKVEYITWDYTVKNLLEENGDISVKSSKDNEQRKKKLTVLSTYPFYPPQGGGQNRTFYLYKELAKSFKVEIVCLAHENDKASKREVANNLWEIRVPKTIAHAHKEWNIEKEVNIPVTDIAFLYLYDETKDFVDAAVESARESDFVICVQPYSYLFAKKYFSHKNIIHESQNIEYLLKKQMLPDNRHSKKLLDKLFDVEKMACEESVLTTVCTMEDAKNMNKLYGINTDNFVEVPNGVDLESVFFVRPKERKIKKRRLDLNGTKLALFIGSWHQPNIEAVKEMFHMAKKSPDTAFLVMGSVGAYFQTHWKENIPSNVGLMGIVSDEEKATTLSIVDFALNPMLSGSGTNLKMLDYMAAGIPVISTPVGARGLNIEDGMIDICDTEDFVKCIAKKTDTSRVLKARKFVEKRYSWKVIGKNYHETLLNTLKNLT